MSIKLITAWAFCALVLFASSAISAPSIAGSSASDIQAEGPAASPVAEEDNNAEGEETED
jgi:hypothetical protein